MAGAEISARSDRDSITRVGIAGADAVSAFATAGSMVPTRPILGGKETVGVGTIGMGGAVGRGVGVIGGGGVDRRQAGPPVRTARRPSRKARPLTRRRRRFGVLGGISSPNCTESARFGSLSLQLLEGRGAGGFNAAAIGIDRAPFLPTERTAKKWLSVETPFRTAEPGSATKS